MAEYSGKRAIGIALVVFVGLFFATLIILFAISHSGTEPISDEEHLEHHIVLSSEPKFPWKLTSLPNFVRPLHYTIQLHPNLTTLNVTGWVVIKFIVLQETDFIVFHGRNLLVIEKWVKEEVENSHDLESLNISRLLEYPPSQQMYLELAAGSKLVPGKNYSLGIRFHANISNMKAEGLYRNSYVDAHGETRYFARTHFDPTYARSAFPCFDEPQFKARFKMIIIRDEKHKSKFSTPIKKIETVYHGYNMELERDEFEESAEMSANEISFDICDYDSVANRKTC